MNKDQLREIFRDYLAANENRFQYIRGYEKEECDELDSVCMDGFFNLETLMDLILKELKDDKKE